MLVKLQGLEFKDLYQALHGTFNLPDFDEMLFFLGRPREDIITGIVGFPSIVRTVMVAANQQGWMVELIEAASGFYPTYRNTATPPEIAGFLTKYPRLDPAAIPAEPDPYETLVMRGGRVFIARDDLRQKLRVIGTRDFSRVLVVNGARRSGKTYSRYFLNHVWERNGPQTERMIYVDLDAEVNKPEDLLLAIGRPLGQTAIPAHTSEQDARNWVPAAERWVREGVQKKKKDEGIETWWFILDGFAAKTHESTTYDIILQLAKSADLDMQELRLVLLNYGQRLGGHHLFVNEEKIPDIGRNEVLGFLKKARDKAGVPLTDAQLEPEADAIFERMAERMRLENAPAQERLCYLSEEVTQTARRLFAGWMP